MAQGLTRTEQFAMMGLVLVICGAMAIRAARTTGSVLPDDSSQWELLKSFAANPAPSSANGPKPHATARPEAPPVRTGEPPSSAAIDLNRASEEEFERLPGIGPAKARAIVEYRDRVGGFRSIDQISEVKGVGGKNLDRLRPYLTLEAPTAQSALPPEPPQPPPAATPPGTRPAAGRVNLNRAEAAELEKLPGIGPRLAERIVQRRHARPFASVEELLEIQGIGEKNFEILRPWVDVK